MVKLRLFHEAFRIFNRLHLSEVRFDIIRMPQKRKLATQPESDNGNVKQKKLNQFFTVVDVTVTKTISHTSTEGIAIETSETGLIHLLEDAEWKKHLRTEFNKPYFTEVENFLRTAYDKGTKIFPPKSLIFNAFNWTPLRELKVVIIGQDPYHGENQAHGLSFSVPLGVDAPPSLKNIYKELSTDIQGFRAPTHGCLEQWAKRGVLMLNATLTVEAHRANSHSHIGWQTFTDAAIKLIVNECRDIVFILWGGFAHRKAALIDGVGAKRGHVVIKTAHPSPLSATKFFGCRCFSKANEALKQNGRGEIDWQLD